MQTKISIAEIVKNTVRKRVVFFISFSQAYARLLYRDDIFTFLCPSSQMKIKPSSGIEIAFIYYE